MNSSQDQCQQCSDKLHQGSSLVTGARMYFNAYTSMGNGQFQNFASLYQYNTVWAKLAKICRYMQSHFAKQFQHKIKI